MPRISVVIPSYNHAKYVAGSIRSVLDQTYQDFEIVITDDGSTDGTVDEIKKIKDPRIRLFVFEKNRGAALANTKCVSEARGEYLAPLSSDDMFLPEKLEKQVKFLDEHPNVWAVFGQAQIIDEEGNDFVDTGHFYYNIFKQPNRTRFEWLRHFFYNGNCLCHPSVLARRDCYTAIAPPEPRFAQLGDFNRWIRLCLKHDIHIIPENLVKFRVRALEANASGNRPDVLRRANFEMTHVFRNYFEIDTVEDFLKVFPDAKKYGNVEKDLIPYFMARIAIDSGNFYPVHQYLGISMLFELLGDKETAGKLEKKYGFGYPDFIRFTGEHDLFDTESRILRQQLEQKERRIESLLNSISWKITAPLRGAASIFKK